MKLIVSKTAIEMAVKNICRVINPKNALPILGDILCMVDEQQQTITMTGSDSEAWLHYKVQLQECEGGGSFCIGADLLRDALSELSEQPVTILATTESDMKFRLQHESGETELPLEASDEYPTPRWFEAGTRTEWTLQTGMVKRVLKRSMFATANDDLRPVMNGVYFDQVDGTLNIVASNGHVLIRNAEQVENTDGSFIMTKKAANLLPTLLEGGDEECKVEFDERLVSFECGLMTFVFLMVNGKYPNYMSVIPQDAPYSLQADRQALLKAVRNVAHFTNSSSRMVRMVIYCYENTMTLYGEDYDFSTTANDRINIDIDDAKDMTIGVKADSIIDELSRIAEPTVSIHFTDPSRAVTIVPEDPLYQGEEITMLLMPMLVNE